MKVLTTVVLEVLIKDDYCVGQASQASSTSMGLIRLYSGVILTIIDVSRVVADKMRIYRRYSWRYGVGWRITVIRSTKLSFN